MTVIFGHFNNFLTNRSKVVNCNNVDPHQSILNLILFPKEMFLDVYFLLTDSKFSPAPKVEEGLIQGDFKLSARQKLNLKLYGNIYGPTSRGASGRERERWPGAIIPYVFDCSVCKSLLLNEKILT